MVIGPADAKSVLTRNHGRWRTTGSESRSLPASRSCRIAVAVNIFDTEPSRNGVEGVTGAPVARSALPYPLTTPGGRP